MEFITLCFILISRNSGTYGTTILLYYIIGYMFMNYIQVIFRPSFTGESIKWYACWDPFMLTEIK